MKKIIQYLRFSAIVVGTVAFLAGKNASAQTCTNTVTSYPGTANGVTIDYFGDASFTPPRTSITCNQAAPPISQFYGNGTTLTAGGYTFSSPVNDVVFWVGGMHDTPAYGAEKVAWSTNGGNTSVTSSNYCMGVLSGSTFTSSGSADPSGSNSAGGYFTVHSTSPFTSIVLIHTQGNKALNGASVLLCSGSVVPCLASPVLSAVTQPTCTTSTGSFTINNYDSGLTYTITPAGATMSGSVVTVPAGTGPYSVTANNGTCSSGTTESGTVNAQPSTPSSPVLSAVTQPTCTTSTGSFNITNYNAALTYTITPAGATRSGSVITAPAGTGPYSVTASNGTCTSGAVQSGNVNAQPSPPSAPTISVTNPTCTVSTGSVAVNSPVSDATYTLSPGNIISTTGSFTGLAAGSGPYTVTSTIAYCTSAVSNSVSIGAAATGCAGAPDLASTILNDGTALSAGATRDNVISITNLGGVTTDVIIVNIPKMAPNFVVTIPSSATTMDVFGGYTVDNTKWTIVEEATRFVLTSNPGVAIPTNGSLEIGVKEQATGLAHSSGNLTVRIVFGTGGAETPTSNNDDNNTYTVN